MDIKIHDWGYAAGYPAEDGLFLRVAEEAYHADKTRLSKHQHDAFRRSPEHYLALYQGKAAHKNTTAMQWGSALDVLITEPGVFEKTYRRGPDVARNTNAWKEFCATLEPGQIGLKGKEFDDITGARARLQNNPLTNGLLFSSDTYTQIAVNWQWITQRKAISIPMRSRLDALHLSPEGVTIVDLKRAQDSSEDGFGRAIASYDYAFQHAIYIQAVGQAFDLDEYPDFLFVAIEPEYPHAIGVHRIHPKLIETVTQVFSDSMEYFAACVDLGEFVNTGEEFIQEPKIPGYYFKKLHDELEKSDVGQHENQKEEIVL